jgi:regulatory protein
MRRALKLKGSKTEARSYALKLLSYRSRSRKEMLERLIRKGFNEEQTNNAILFLEEAGLIKDETLAEELFSYALGRKNLGRRGIESFLSKRGIGQELISQTLSVHTKDMEMDAAQRIIDRKLRILRRFPVDVIKRRLSGMLQRRGVRADVINKTIQSLDL